MTIAGMTTADQNAIRAPAEGIEYQCRIDVANWFSLSEYVHSAQGY
jgi:hypothetical protein